MPYPPSVVGVFGEDWTFYAFDELTPEEKAAVDIIKSSLRSNGLPDTPLFFRYTDRYLAIGGNKHHPFARLKLDANLWYVGLSCGDPVTGKNFCRFEISNVEEIKNYSSEIAAAFRFCDPALSQKKLLEVDGYTLSPELKQFFGKFELSNSVMSFAPNSAEIEFFSAYIEKLKSAGLDWGNVPCSIYPDGVISVRGGRVRLRKKVTHIAYWKAENELVTTEKNLTFPEYVELQKYWISHCLANKEIYNL